MAATDPMSASDVAKPKRDPSVKGMAPPSPTAKGKADSTVLDDPPSPTAKGKAESTVLDDLPSPTSVLDAAKGKADPRLADQPSLKCYGACKAQGKMDHMEDSVLVVEYDDGMILGCVFDGHGGHTVADYCTNRVAELVKSQVMISKEHQEEAEDHGAALKAALAQLDPGLREAYGGNREQLVGIGGSTALVALLDQASGRLTLAYLGDGRAILCRSGVAMQMNVEHNPCNPEERARVLAAGGTIDEDDRVEGEECSLSVSRSIGDFDFKMDESRRAEEQVVSSVPDVSEVVLETGDEFLILSSDGTQCWTNQELVDFVRPRIEKRQQDLSSICEELLMEVDGIDNTGLVIVKFERNKKY